MMQELTPCENIEGLWLKREDKFCPFGVNTVNGGKLRQCFALVENIKDNYKGLITFCSIHSPQAPITASVAKHFGLNCIILYGGTTEESLKQNEMALIAQQYGANIKIVAKTGRHNVLFSKAKEYAKENNYFIVEYGFNIIEHPKLLLNAVARQVENIPNKLENLVITCGSGITTTGVLIGLKKYNKKVDTIYLVDTAPNRVNKIRNNLKLYNIDYDKEFNVKVIDLFNMKGFVYEKGINVIYKGIKLHPQYEAKTFSWLYYHSGINIHNGKSLLWIVGAKPEPKGGNINDRKSQPKSSR